MSFGISHWGIGRLSHEVFSIEDVTNKIFETSLVQILGFLKKRSFREFLLTKEMASQRFRSGRKSFQPAVIAA